MPDPDNAIERLLAQEWLEEGIWCIFCEADRAGDRPVEPHAEDCIWATLKREQAPYQHPGAVDDPASFADLDDPHDDPRDRA
jgi:hypothetical protein